ncbi:MULTISPECIES: effector-associated constant component EACC1 [Nocardia]|uniref:effector-associated constant component EACC1 n=1 Tax=Nocardia nova TaxID=37330 RepID=UPI0025B06384|nr:hypothetical protein [Nocardia nova]MDN2497463.1 hypothetical protein [Nocardia nova]
MSVAVALAAPHQQLPLAIAFLGVKRCARQGNRTKILWKQGGEISQRVWNPKRGVMTEFGLSIADSEDDAAELHDLYAAIIEDDELRSARKRLEAGQPGANRMGAEEIIRLVIENPSLDAAVSTCIAAWLATRRSRRMKVIIRADRSVEVEADGIKSVTAADIQDALRSVRIDDDDETA